MKTFAASIMIIGINPYISVPPEILSHLFTEHGSEKSPIPIHGEINGQSYTQTLVKFQGDWRLYINTIMLKNSPKRIGEVITLSIAYDATPRDIPLHADLKNALEASPAAKKVFDSLPPYHQKEINRYISRLKHKEVIEKNVQRAVGYLLGKNRFVGRAPIAS